MRILVVEDHPLIALSLELFLADAGHSVLGPASSLDDALIIAERASPELALVDIKLDDGYTGPTVARELSNRFGVPSIFVSGQTTEARINKDAALGLILKPFLPDTVLRGVEVAKALVGSGAVPEQLPNGMELFAGVD